MLPITDADEMTGPSSGSKSASNSHPGTVSADIWELLYAEELVSRA